LSTGFVALFLRCLRDVVVEKGFFSVWFDAFHDVPVVKQLLIQAFPNTAPCFSATDFDPVPRTAGDL
jgi:hypothetical protein